MKKCAARVNDEPDVFIHLFFSLIDFLLQLVKFAWISVRLL